MKNLLLSFVLLFSFSALFAQTAQFTASVQSGCSPLVVNFDASASTGTGALSYAWDFGNGNTTAGPGQQQPGAAYVQPGTYTVSLTITDASGQTATQTQSITVFPNPTADFVVSDSLGCPPLNVAMTDLSLPANAPIVAWNWDFGDGNGSTQTNPSHSYAAGTYTLALIVTDANGCQDVVSYPNLITTYPGVSASFNPNGPLRTCNPTLAVSLQAQLQTQSNGPFSYQWDFGDGNTATGNPGQNNYQGSGSYDITLSVLDQSTGCSHLLTEPGLVELVDPNFSFAISDSAGCAPLTTQFSPQLPTNDPGVLLTWDFGDGNTLSGIAQNPSVLNPVYTYQNAGTFSPSLTVDLGPDLCVLSSTANNAITAGGLAQIDFTVSDSVACQPPLAVNFTPNAPGAQSWLWDFGDGTTDTTANPSHTYLNGGNYDVSLTIVNAQGCVQTFSEADLIRIQAPQAAFAHNLNDYTVFPELWDGRDASVICGGCLPLDITFTDQSASLTPIIDWQWDFGDGNALAGANANPLHTYTTEGEFTVSLTITTQDGCMSTVVCDSCIRAGNRPTAMLDTTGYPLLQCCSAQTLFQNATTDPHDYVWYFVTTGDWHGVTLDDTTNGDWDFGSTVPVFLDSGQYVSTMFYTYNYGCVDSFWLEDWTMLRPPYGSAGIDTFACMSNWPPGGTIFFDTSMVSYVPDTSYIDSVLWTFGDPAGSTSNDLYPTFTYPDTGAYWVGVTVWNYSNGCKCKTSGEQFLQIKVMPDTTFIFNPSTGCAPLDVAFTGPVTEVADWQWEVGGDTSSVQNPNFRFEEPGSYDIELIVANAEGCADTVYRPDAIVVEGIAARIEASVTEGCAPLTINFVDRSLTTTPIVSRDWSFGDGAALSGNDSVVSYTYAQAYYPPEQQLDSIPVILSLTDSAGCTDADTIWVRIFEPIAAFVADTAGDCLGDTLYFQALSGDSIGLGNLSYDWQFTNNPPSLLSNPVRYFVAGGPYPLSLMVTDSMGCSTTLLDSLLVDPVLPQADFSAFPTTATCPPLAVSFTDLSQPGRAPIVSWQWDFGDGGSSSLSDPMRIFTQEGSYSISLTVVDALGCSDTYSLPDLIQLTGVQGSFTISQDTLCAGETALFSAVSPNAGNYTWDFGDGNIALGPQQFHVYDQTGFQYPILILEDSTGTCSRSLLDTLLVHPIPDVLLPADTALCRGDSIRLNVFQPDVSFLWNTGATSPSLTIGQTGWYSVTLTDSITGCQDRDSLYVLVNPLPQIAIQGDSILCEGDTISLLAVSPDSIILYQWNRPSLSSDGPDHRRLAPSTNLLLRLRVQDEKRCWNSDSLNIEVIPEPLISLQHDPVCDGDTLWLDATPSNINVPASYFWWDDNGPLDHFTPQIGLTNAGNYRVLYQWRGCETEEETSVSFYPLPEHDAYAEYLNCVYKGTEVVLDAGPAADYWWFHSGQTTREVAVVEDGLYRYEVYNVWGCATPDSFRIIDACPPTLYLPTGFTPNDDGYNDRWGWAGDYIDHFQMRIYSRWGMILYETRDYLAAWDGTHNGQPVPEGVYTYVVSWNGTHPDHKEIFQRAGTITLFR